MLTAKSTSSLSVLWDDSTALLGVFFCHETFSSIWVSPLSFFSPTIPPQFFPSLGSRNLFVFIFPQRQKPNKRKQLFDADTKPLGLRSSAKDEYELPFLVPHTLTPISPPLSTPSKVLPHFPSLDSLGSSGPNVHRFPCSYFVGFLTEAISSPITREIKPAVKMILLVFYSPSLAIKSQKLFSQKGLLQAHTRTMQKKGKPWHPAHPPTE